MSDLLLSMHVLLSEEERRAVVKGIDSARKATYYQRRVRASYDPPLPQSTEDLIRAVESRDLKSLEQIREKFLR